MQGVILDQKRDISGKQWAKCLYKFGSRLFNKFCVDDSFLVLIVMTGYVRHHIWGSWVKGTQKFFVLFLECFVSLKVFKMKLSNNNKK